MRIAGEVDLEKTPILFYDGDCGFCSGAVQFVLKHRIKPVYFVPLQSEKAKFIIDGERVSGGEKISMNTMYFLHKGRIYRESAGVLRVCLYLKGCYPVFFYLGILIPRFIRNAIYCWVAKRRFQLVAPSCLLPTVSERELFI
jgi:predicted DCC family thiol-disulfide oxidoreductase YuxK